MTRAGATLFAPAAAVGAVPYALITLTGPPARVNVLEIRLGAYRALSATAAATMRQYRLEVGLLLPAPQIAIR
jgi:hypothetical protein